MGIGCIDASKEIIVQKRQREREKYSTGVTNVHVISRIEAVMKRRRISNDDRPTGSDRPLTTSSSTPKQK